MATLKLTSETATGLALLSLEVGLIAAVGVVGDIFSRELFLVVERIHGGGGGRLNHAEYVEEEEGRLEEEEGGVRRERGAGTRRGEQRMLRERPSTEGGEEGI